MPAVDPLHKPLIRISTAGSVDDGKSTLFGRLLLDTGSIYADTLASIERSSQKLGTGEELALALVTDGLKAEREQGITIDVAYRYMSTPNRTFILADSPGHEQYTRNMATAASTADLAIILIDATKGVLPQTRRHAFISSLLGVRRLLMAVNKMDLVEFSQEVFERIKEEFTEFASRLEVHDLRFIPVSALAGDNVVIRSSRCPWYQGETVLEYLDNVYVGSDQNLVDLRFPVQHVIRDAGTYRAFAGQVLSGIVRTGDEVMVLPSGRKSRVKKIEWKARGQEQKTSARARESVALCLEDEIDISRGDMIVRPLNAPAMRNEIEAMVVWMSEKPLDRSLRYLIRHTTREAQAVIEQVHYRVDVNTLSREPASTLCLNEIGRLSLHASKPLAADTYRNNRLTGNFILIDPVSFSTVAAGLVIDRKPESTQTTLVGAASSSAELHPERSLVAPAERTARTGVPALTFWFTGLSGAGKSTIARILERKLFDHGVAVFRLDGDTLRSGLNKDLGFSRAHRSENLRRAAEVARLMNEAGLVVLGSFITPREDDRQVVRAIVTQSRFVHVFVDTPLTVCEQRDPHGLYRKARDGKISDFTGVSAPFETPTDADITVETSQRSIEECAERVLIQILSRLGKGVR